MELIAIAAVILVGVGVFLFMRRKKGGIKVPTAPGWQLQWSDGGKMIGDSLFIPASPGVVGTVTKKASPLTGKTGIRMRYRLDGNVVADEMPESPATIALYFQREGDKWTAVGEYEAYRWYASFAVQKLVPGEHVLEARFDENWTAVMMSSRESNGGMFNTALAKADRIGFVLGGADGLAHGVHGPATLTILEFTVE